MSEVSERRLAARNGQIDISISVGLVIGLLFFLVTGAVALWNIETFNQDSREVVQTEMVLTALDDLLSTLKDAETGQRGFVITGRESYLEPYNTARAQIEQRLNMLREADARNTQLQVRIKDMEEHANKKMAELAETISLRRDKGFEVAKALVITDRGKNEMDALRSEIKISHEEAENLRVKRLAEMENAHRTAMATTVLSAIMGIVVTVAVWALVRRARIASVRQEWVQTGIVGMGKALFGELRAEQLAANVINFLAEYLDAQVGAFYGLESGAFKKVGSYGLPANAAIPDFIGFGDGLVGQAAFEMKPLLVKNVPDNYLTVGSSLGGSNPRQLLIAPAIANGEVRAVLELGFFHPISDQALELLKEVEGPIGIAFLSASDRTKLQNLLEETQLQGEELQAQGEELRVSNEELSEQSRALQESQFRLEQQQAELEQSNSQLEEQTQILEAQRDDLKRSKVDLESQASELERTSRYKSDFLANMSHELRTPLNSSLILAKLLADNREGNLTAEQVKYANTIQSAGNDLLALISDILDLSKIEAGHMEVIVQKTSITDIVANLVRTFEPTATQKSLKFITEIADGTPEFIVTDAQRLEQVLKNLLSNAMKFTEKGQVSLRISLAAPGQISFAVQDSGIGIDPEQQQMVFEAFRQADGTTNRKYGGTGLGLSISRELAGLLGGSIGLHSAAGEGSIFTVTVPEKIQGTSSVQPSPAPLQSRVSQLQRPTAQSQEPRQADPGNTEEKNGRSILVVEDDVNFGQILRDLAEEYGFKCFLAHDAATALDLAFTKLPDAVLLDIGLPDTTGLSVLDRLKRDQRTRHIPVHVVSGGDYSHTAMELGAIGYMLKPVKREDLSLAFQTLEASLTQKLRRVLIVEDDAVQQESLKLLLGSRDVETVGVGSAAECLEALRTTTYDCMVLDLSLPDASGFTLLETLSKEEAFSFPPVIVYTGRDLSSNEEQHLSRYSKSIIVKGAKSPERLLDEVTLFLHQVVSELPVEKQQLLEKAKHRDAALEDRIILIVEDDVRNVFALTSVLEPKGAKIEIARNGRESLEFLARTKSAPGRSVDLVLMDIMMPEMDGFEAMREIRKQPEFARLPIIALTAKAMKHDQEQCLKAGANDYIAKPLDVEKLLSLIRVWLPRD